MKRTILLVGICCALTAPAATVSAAKSVTKAAEAPTQEAINNALTELLAERESWSGAAAPGSASPAGADVAGITAGATGDLSAFLALRTTWGQGPAAKAINAPLAKGASSSFPRSETVAAPGPSPQTIVQPEVARPLPKLALVSQADIVRARNALLSERDSWGKEPSLAAMPALSVIETYFAERDSWGKGPAAEPVSAPLAKGATKKLTFASRFVVAEATRKTIVHEFKPQPPVQLAQVDQSQTNKAMQDLLAEREGWGTTPAVGSAQGGATATGGTGDMAALLAEREGWGTGPKPRTIKAPLAKGAEAKVRLSKTAPVGDSKPPIVHELEARPIPVVADIDMATINKAMQGLLAEREGWGTTPAVGSAQDGATATGGTGDMAALLAEREGWGTGPKPRTIKAPLAKGAEAKVRLSKTAPVGDSKPPIVHELEARPIPVVADIDMATINKAMQGLLAEREGWGTTPAVGSAQDGATATGGTGDMAALLAEREGWGTGPRPRTIKAPLAKGAEAKVRLSKTAPVGDSKPPIVHELEARPIPVVADIDMAIINKAMQDLLAEREGWGTTPAAGSAQGGATATGGTGDMAALLAERESWGVKPSQSSTSTSTAAAAPAAGTTAASRRSCSDELSRLASERKIFFGSSSAKLQSKSSKVLEQIAETIKSCGDVIILIEGHTDSIGTTGANQALSEARAKAVLEYLAAAGVERSRLKAIGHGESKPIASNASSEDRALNRRIEFGTP